MRIYFLLVFLFTVNLVAAQHACGFEAHRARLTAQDSTLHHTYMELSKSIADNIHATNSRTEMVIPVVVHIVWEDVESFVSDEVILSQIDVLNRDFNGMNQDLIAVPTAYQSLIAKVGIRFCLASKDENDQPTNGIVKIKTNNEKLGQSNDIFYSDRGGSDAWDTEKYLNIWVCNLGGFISGYGTFPMLSLAAETGVVIDYKYFGINEQPKYGLGRTAVHEVGHYLGLKHLWGTDSQCETDDGIEDTPPQARAYNACPTGLQMSCGTDDLYMNFMDYVYDPCMVFFTKGQKEWMRSVLQNFRPGLINHSVCGEGSSSLISSDFSVFPNPISKQFRIHFETVQAKLLNCQFYNGQGQLVEEESYFINNELELDISHFPKGIYFCKIAGVIKKLVKL